MGRAEWMAEFPAALQEKIVDAVVSEIAVQAGQELQSTWRTRIQTAWKPTVGFVVAFWLMFYEPRPHVSNRSISGNPVSNKLYVGNSLEMKLGRHLDLG